MNDMSRPSKKRLEQIKDIWNTNIGCGNWQDVQDLLSEINALQAQLCVGTRQLEIIASFDLFKITREVDYAANFGMCVGSAKQGLKKIEELER